MSKTIPFKKNVTFSCNPPEVFDMEQPQFMDEACIVVDENDNPIGSASKRVCKPTFPP